MSYLSQTQMGQLLRPLNGRRVLQKQGKSHMEAYDIRAHLNRIFGFGRWDGDVTEMTLVSERLGKNKSGNDAVTVIYRAGYRLAVRAMDGTPLATYTEYAAGDAQNFPLHSLGDAHDFAMKTAESQALKRAAINLGDQFGLSLYNKGSLGPLVGATLALPDAEPSKEGVDDGTPEVTPEESPEQIPDSEGAPEAPQQARQEPQHTVNWQQSLTDAKGNAERLAALRVMASRAGAPQHYMTAVDTAIHECTPLEGVVTNA